MKRLLLGFFVLIIGIPLSYAQQPPSETIKIQQRIRLNNWKSLIFPNKSGIGWQTRT